MNRTKISRIAFLLLCTILLQTGCEMGRSSFGTALPAEPLYLVTGGNFHHHNRNNALYIIDPANWQVVRRIRLPRKTFQPMIARDPSGRIWIGLGEDENLLVFSPTGRQLKKLKTCFSPISGTYFANGRAFVVCSLYGFTGQVDVFDLDTFELLKSIELVGVDPTKPDYLAIQGSGATNGKYVVVGGHMGDSTAPSYDGPLAIATIINSTTMEIEEQIILERTSLSDIFVHNDIFYIQNKNVNEYSGIEEEALLALQVPENIVTRYPLPHFAAEHGAITEQQLFSYHTTRNWSQEPYYALTQINLDTKEIESLAFGTREDRGDPERTIADISVMDMEIIKGELILLTITPHGLTHFDPQTGKATQLLEIDNNSLDNEIVSTMLWASESE